MTTTEIAVTMEGSTGHYMICAVTYLAIQHSAIPLPYLQPVFWHTVSDNGRPVWIGYGVQPTESAIIAAPIRGVCVVLSIVSHHRGSKHRARSTAAPPSQVSQSEQQSQGDNPT